MPWKSDILETCKKVKWILKKLINWLKNIIRYFTVKLQSKKLCCSSEYHFYLTLRCDDSHCRKRKLISWYAWRSYLAFSYVNTLSCVCVLPFIIKPFFGATDVNIFFYLIFLKNFKLAMCVSLVNFYVYSERDLEVYEVLTDHLVYFFVYISLQ